MSSTLTAIDRCERSARISLIVDEPDDELDPCDAGCERIGPFSLAAAAGREQCKETEVKDRLSQRGLWAIAIVAWTFCPRSGRRIESAYRCRLRMHSS